MSKYDKTFNKEKILDILEDFDKDPYMGYENFDEVFKESKITSQPEILARLLNRENVFISGLAGTGKTTVINRFVDFINAEFDNQFYIAITASTGIAATLIGGQTIHSWSGLGIFSEDFDPKKVGYGFYPRVFNLQKVDILIIDEISMLPAHILINLDKMLKYYRKNDNPFGGVQIVAIGDFLQLPPVKGRNSTANMDFCIQTQEWKEAKFSYCFLDKTYRTTDPRLKKVLEDISENKISDETKKYIQSRIGAPKKSNNVYATLFTVNKNVDTYNSEKLESNPNPEKIFYTLESGPKEYIDKAYKENNVPKSITLKQDTTVIATKNFYAYSYKLQQEVFIANGTIGKITRFVPERKPNEKKSNLVYVRNGVFVEFNGLGECFVPYITYEYSEKKEYVYVVDGKEVKKYVPITLSSLNQLPLKLGYAITVHKSQGQTFNGVEVNLAQCFQDGLGYVALSRVKDLDDLIITGFSDRAYKVSTLSQNITKFVKKQATKGRNNFIENQEHYDSLLTNSLYRYLFWNPEESSKNSKKN